MASGSSVDSEDSKVECPFTNVIVLGMAGSGKTSLVHRLTHHLHAKKRPPYLINLDPAVYETPFPANIDIRDAIKYKEVMKQYGLGPNGAIMTSLNLFATRFDQVMGILESKTGIEQGDGDAKSSFDHVLIDTPGQIEVFTWSASGSIITEALASSFPTVVIYVIDVAKCAAPVTFMSNMLYALSIMYRCNLPFILALNKIDIISHSFIQEWMSDYEKFQEALANEESYSSTLANSMSLVLEKFYSTLKSVGVSAFTGAGMDDLVVAIGNARQEYFDEYVPMMRKMKAKKKSEQAKERERMMLHKDLDKAKDSRSITEESISAPNMAANLRQPRLDRAEDDGEENDEVAEIREKVADLHFKDYLGKS